MGKPEEKSQLGDLGVDGSITSTFLLLLLL
jgi:hypothetical protein